MRDLVATTETVVGIDAGSGSVEHNVAFDDRLRRLRLDEERRLLLVQTYLAYDIASDCGELRVLTVGAVDARCRVTGQRYARATGIGGLVLCREGQLRESVSGFCSVNRLPGSTHHLARALQWKRVH